MSHFLNQTIRKGATLPEKYPSNQKGVILHDPIFKYQKRPDVTCLFPT